MLHAQSHALATRNRLRNPPNPVPDLGIDLKRQPISIVALPVIEQPAPKIVPDLGIGQLIPNYTLFYPRAERRPTTIKEIQKTVCVEFNVNFHDVMSQRRTADIVFPRQVAMWLVKRLTKHSLPEIGRRFQGRDHTTILHGVRKIERLRLQDCNLNDRLNSLMARLSPLEVV